MYNDGFPLLVIVMTLSFVNFIITLFCLCITIKAAVPNAQQQFLATQNAARAAVRVPPLVWSPKVAKYAESYANQRRADCALQHSGGPYGENIFWGSGDGWTPAQAAADWVGEKPFYDYGSNSCASGKQCGHYTQIVWRDTKEIGCARVVCDGGKGVFMTCNYDPPGNYIGERPY